jgi:hypothetical protein
MKNQKLIKMEKFIEKEKERIYMMKDLFQT